MIRFGAARILAAAVVLALALVALVAREHQAREAGTEVRLAVGLVDPRELLTGHYVQLNYAQPMAAGEACPKTRPDDRWVALAPGAGDVHRAVGAATTREAAAALGPVQVRGQLNCLEGDEAGTRPGMLTLHIGADRFHADQQQAEALERRLRQVRPEDPASAFAVVSVGDDGRARLVGLVVDGRRTELSMF